MALPLEKELLPFSVLEWEPISEYAKKLFRNYRDVRAEILEKQSAMAEARARLANRFRKKKELELNDRVLCRDPRLRSTRAGGRTPWRKQLSEPMTIVELHGNRANLSDDRGQRQLGSSRRAGLLARAPLQGVSRILGSARSPVRVGWRV